MGTEKTHVIPRAKEQAGYGNGKSTCYTPRQGAGGVWEQKKHMSYPAPRSRRGMGIEKAHVIPHAKEQAGYGNRKSTCYTPCQGAGGVWEQKKHMSYPAPRSRRGYHKD